MRRDSWWRVSHHNHGALKINIELNKATKIYATWCILESRPYSIHQTLSFTLWGHSWWTLLRHEARVMTYGRLSVTRGHSGLSNDPACSQTSFSTIPFNSVWVWSDITDNSAHIGGVFPWQDIIIVSPKKVQCCSFLKSLQCNKKSSASSRAKGSPQTIVSGLVGILSQPGRPPPPLPLPEGWDSQKGEEKNYVYFAFQAILSILFFHEKFHFLVGTTKGGVQYPHELIRYWPPIYVLCVSSHFWPFTKAN